MKFEIFAKLCSLAYTAHCDKGECTCSWSDNPKAWDKFTKQELLDLKKSKGGEFYIDIKDFVRIFNQLSICHLSLKPELKWHEEKEYGSWTANAGMYNVYRAPLVPVRLLSFYFGG